MRHQIKYLILFILLFAGFSIFSQSITQQEVLTGLTGKWKFVYENELGQVDTISLVDSRIIELKKQKGKETGLFKDGSQIRSSIKWKFIESDKGIVILFTGGIWVNDQEFIIKEITPDKITMLSCDKHDDCDLAYFIKI